MKSIFIGFDFSMNKPACTILFEKEFYFLIWPSDLDAKKVKRYEDSGVYVRERGLDAVSTKDKNSQIVLEHTKRSTDLANMIVADIDQFIKDKNAEDCPIYVASEGLSYGSKGDATLNLATYKGVLLSKLYEHYYGRMYGLYTYAPITIKSVAGCAGKNKASSKTPMIDAFMREQLDGVRFHDDLKKGLFLNKTSYIKCVDDIVDSYWAVKTMLKKEGFIK